MKNIIKADQLVLPATNQRKTLLKRAVIEANDEARIIVEKSESYAEELRQQVESEALELRESSYREGKEKALIEMTNLLLEAREIRDKTLSDTEQDILRLAIKLAEKIIGREIKTDKTTVVDIVSNALRNAKRQDKLTIRVSQTDYATVQDKFVELSQSSRTSYVDIVPDPRVSLGGCIIESEVGTIDARLETQLRVLEKALLGQTDLTIRPKN
jgi:type III secretion protein L